MAQRIRHLTEGLGQARDLDVQILSVQSFARTARDDWRAGLLAILKGLLARRRRLQEKVLGDLDDLESSGELKRMRRAMRKIAVGPRKERRIAASPPVRRQMARSLLDLLEELLSYESYVRRPGCVDELHRMRIAASASAILSRCLIRPTDPV